MSEHLLCGNFSYNVIVSLYYFVSYINKMMSIANTLVLSCSESVDTSLEIFIFK